MQQNQKNKNIFQIVQNFISDVIGFIQYRKATKSNYYPCKLIGEKPNNAEQSNTVIIYRHIGKREIFEISVKDLLDKRDLLERFHPTEAVKFGAIAMGDILFQENPGIRKQRANIIKRKMLDSTKG